MTIDVNAVPPMFREYKFPRSPTAIAPMQDTTSDRLKMNISAILFAAYAQHEMMTMTTISHVQRGCRFEREEKTEKTEHREPSGGLGYWEGRSTKAVPDGEESHLEVAKASTGPEAPGLAHVHVVDL